ncbi:MAG: amino acid ABC transporter permease [Oscillospiraceae bacterium]
MSVISQLLGGLGQSLLLFVLTLVFSIPLGLLVTFGRMSTWAPLHGLADGRESGGGLRGVLARFKPIQFFVKICISILRGTPLMLQLMVVFYGPYYLFGASLSTEYRFIAVILGFSVNYAAYFAEIFRSGIEGIPVGQREAAQVLGYSRSQTFLKIILPQMAKRVLPPVTNEFITLVKDTSLAFVLSYMELFTIAKQIAAAQTTILPLFVAGVFYFIFNGIVATVMDRVEKRMSYYN